MIQRTMPVLWMILAYMIIAGCSSQTNPVTPSQDVLSGQPMVGVSDRFPDGSPASGVGALGIFDLCLNADEISAELTPLRQNSLTDVLEIVDITNFLQVAPCTDCAQIKSVELNSDNNLVVSIGIKHPFGVGDPLKPISGQNRADLHVFNVEGMVVSNSTTTTFPGLGKNVADLSLVNADGYSGYLDTVLDDIYPTDASVHPYITHFDDYSSGNFDPANPMGFDSVTDPPPSGNLVMAMGCDYDYQDYVFQIEDSIDFIFAIGCTYAVSSSSKSERFNPEYRIPQHNKKAASEISLEIISNDLVALDTLSSAEVEVHVVDVSHGVAVGTNLDEMLADSSVDTIFIDIPGITGTLITIDGGNPAGGLGHDPSDPLVYQVTITNELAADLGTYPGLVKVLDSYSPGLNDYPLLGGFDGIQAVDPFVNPINGLFSITEFATYYAFYMEILKGNEPPVADLIPIDAEIQSGQTIIWDATASFDPDGTISQYEWDFDILDGDPVNFNPDEITTTPVSTQESTEYNELGTFYAAVRVTDDLLATDIAVQSFEVLEITAHYWTQFMSNENHNGQTNVIGPQTNNVEWTFDAPGFQALIVTEGYDGTIYFGTSASGLLYAVTPDGNEKWHYPDSLAVTWASPMGVTPDDSILYAAVDPTIGVEYIVGLDTATGNELWSYQLRCTNATYAIVLENGDLVASGCVGSSGTDQFTDRIDKNGNQVWSTPTSVNFTAGPVQGLDGTIYARSNNDLIAIDPANGDITGSYAFNANMQCTPAVRSDGSIVFGGNNGSVARIFCVDADLNEEWTLLVGSSVPIRGLGIGANDEIYITFNSCLYAIAADGSQVDWTAYGISSISSPAVGNDGLIYTGTSSGVAAYNPNGTQKWSVPVPGGYGGAPMIAHDGALYVNISSVLYKIEDE